MERVKFGTFTPPSPRFVPLSGHVCNVRSGLGWETKKRSGRFNKLSIGRVARRERTSAKLTETGRVLAARESAESSLAFSLLFQRRLKFSCALMLNPLRVLAEGAKGGGELLRALML